MNANATLNVYNTRCGVKGGSWRRGVCVYELARAYDTSSLACCCICSWQPFDIWTHTHTHTQSLDLVRCYNNYTVLLEWWKSLQDECQCNTQCRYAVKGRSWRSIWVGKSLWHLIFAASWQTFWDLDTHTRTKPQFCIYATVLLEWWKALRVDEYVLREHSWKVYKWIACTSGIWHILHCSSCI